jgi:iron(III) transport system substrate-binding protein
MMRLIAATLWLGLCVTARAQDAEWNKLVEAARAEGNVVVYSALIGPPQEARMRSFEKEFGIRVDEFIGRASEVEERIRIEQTTRRYIDDIYIGTQATLTPHADDGTIQPPVEVPAARNLRSDIERDDYGVPAWIAPYGILINTNLVAPNEMASWKDLLAPKWKGRILSDDLRLVGAGQAMFEPTYKAFGRDFHEKLAGQDLVVTRENRDAERRVAQGEFPLYIPQQLPYALALKGLPVHLVIPREGAIYGPAEFALLKGAPHPNAARLLIDYLLEPDSQLAFANAGLIPVVNGVAEKANDDARPYMSMPLLGYATYAAQKQMMAIAAEIYK